MNSFGRLFRVSIFGESHGNGVGISIDGVPPGILLSVQDFEEDLKRRQGGNQKGTTPRKEDDIPNLLTGVFRNFTTGAPLTILFENKNTRSEDYEKQRAIPRPGHADFVATKKFNGFEDFRGGGHFSGRLTVALVAAGVVAKKVLLHLASGLSDKPVITAFVKEVAGDPDIEKGLQKAIDAKDSVGGVVECSVDNLPIGLGEPFFDSVESLISHAVFSIPAVKAIEFGAGFAIAQMFGIVSNDNILDIQGKTETNNSGGIVGGLSNGNRIVFRIAVKPTSSTPLKQASVNVETGVVEEFSIKGRHDLCIALRVPPVLESVVALVVCDLWMRSIRH